MGLRLVNLFPGSVRDFSKPGQPLLMGLRSDGLDTTSGAGSVALGTLRTSLGYTSVANQGVLPETSVVLQRLGATVAIDTAERIRPLGSQAFRLPSGSGISITGPGTPSTIGVYSVTLDIENDASILGYFKFKNNHAWSLATREWCDLSNMTGLYFGLEDGPSNTMCWASLRGGGTGSLVIGGPMQTFHATRNSQREIPAFDWLAQPDGGVLEMWISFCRTGYPTPFSPALTPILEVWTRRAGVDPIPVCHTVSAPIVIPALGVFPSSPAQFPNFRAGPSNIATLFFGNVTDGADSLELLDWALFPDFRVAVLEGEAAGPNKLTVRSDSPHQYHCVDGRPQDVFPGQWNPIRDVYFLAPSANLLYPPTKSKPSFLVLNKTLGFAAGFQRQEPRLEKKEDGAVIEAFMSAEVVEKTIDTVGAGIAIDDGTNLFQTAFLETDTRRTIGLCKGGVPGKFDVGYLSPPANQDVSLDWRSPKLVRLVVDRLRARVSLFVNEVRYLDVPLASLPPSVSPVGGRVTFGHLETTMAKAKFNVIFLNYLTRYLAWELDEGLLPDAAPAAFTLLSQGNGTQTLSPTALTVNKSDSGVPGSHRYYLKTMPTFDERHGIQVDFKMRVTGYANRTGSVFAKMLWVGAGVQVFLGSKRLHLGCFDCGANGRFIGVIPGSGSVDDIINQTTLGKAFSTPADWTASTLFRLSYRPYEAIDVWVDNIESGPVLSIPWVNDTDGFDLPQDTTVASVAFGHFDRDASSSTEWEYFRYGMGNGYDISIEPQFPNGLPGYLYGGRSLLMTEFDEL